MHFRTTSWSISLVSWSLSASQSRIYFFHSLSTRTSLTRKTRNTRHLTDLTRQPKSPKFPESRAEAAEDGTPGRRERRKRECLFPHTTHIMYVLAMWVVITVSLREFKTIKKACLVLRVQLRVIGCPLTDKWDDSFIHLDEFRSFHMNYSFQKGSSLADFRKGSSTRGTYT